MANGGIIVLGGLGALALLLSQSKGEPAGGEVGGADSKPPTSPPPPGSSGSDTPPSVPLEPLGTDPDAQDDQTALARMLQSESSSFRERVVVGWLTLTRARKLKIPIFQMLTGAPGVYGPQVLGGVTRYAATTEAPSIEARATARDLLAGRLQPSSEIREHGISPWVELLFPKNKDQAVLNKRAERIIALQKPLGKHGDFGGIWARVAESGWFLYSRSAPIVVDDGRPGSALVELYKLPTVPALDSEIKQPKVA